MSTDKATKRDIYFNNLARIYCAEELETQAAGAIAQKPLNALQGKYASIPAPASPMTTRTGS